MGSRAIAVIAKDQEAAERRFGVGDGTTGTVYTRTGLPFFNDTTELVYRLRAAAAPLFESLETDWLALDCELLPWSAKATELIKSQYASVSAAARHALPGALESLAKATARGLDVTDLAARARQRLANAVAFRDAYAAYCRPARGPDGITLAPFQILAAQGRALALTESHEWHLAQLAKLEDDFITPTRHRFVDLSSEQARAEAADWWLEMTVAGGEGVVVKPSPTDRRPGPAGPEGPRPEIPCASSTDPTTHSRSTSCATVTSARSGNSPAASMASAWRRSPDSSNTRPCGRYTSRSSPSSHWSPSP